MRHTIMKQDKAASEMSSSRRMVGRSLDPSAMFGNNNNNERRRRGE